MNVTNRKHFIKQNAQFLFLAGWLIPTGVALLFFARWIREIVVPTLKGGNFDQLYDLHQVRYLDTTLVCVAIALIWITLAVCRVARKQILSGPN
jgi:hypothetical protein